MIKWPVGLPIVCIKSFKGVNKIGVPLDYRPPQKDEIFTYDGLGDFDDFYSCWYIYLKEFSRPKRFNASHFRPVQDVLKEYTEQLVKELEEEIEVEVHI